MKTSLIVFQLVASLFSISLCGEIGVPVLLWQKRTDSQLFDSKSTVSQINGKLLAEDYLTDSQTIVAFVQNRLSLEQFTTEDEERLTSVKSIFKDQSIKPTLLTDVLNPTEALTVKHFQRQEWDAIHIRNGDKVWIQLPEDSLAENNQLLAELIAKIQMNVSKNALFLITGRQNQFQSIDLEPPNSPVHRRVERAAEVEEPEASSGSTDIPYLINLKDCVYLYTTGITLNNITGGITKNLAEFNTSNNNIHDLSGECWTLANKTDNSLPAKLEFRLSENGTDLSFNLVIENRGNNYYWNSVNSTVNITSANFEQLKNGVIFELLDNEIESEQDFGYSCSQMNIRSRPTNVTDKDGEKLITISLVFERFQFQPFFNPHNKKDQKAWIFTDSFDCQVWMTLPLWMGLLTLIVMFVILSIGIYFIAIVNTPDRFENPKGKPLVISATED